MSSIIGVHYRIDRGLRQERRKPKSRYAWIIGYTFALALATISANQVFHLGIGHILSGNQAHGQLTAAVNAKAPAPTTPTVTKAPTERSQVTAAVQNLINLTPTQTWSVAVYDITNKSWLVNINAQQQLASGSMYKLYAAYALAQKVPFEQWQTTQIGGQTMASCVDLMLRVSDTTCSNAIAAYVTPAAIDNYVHGAGYTGTTMVVKTGAVTSTYDTVRFMSNLYQGKLFDNAGTAFVLNSLLHEVYRTGIPAGCTTGCTVYDKAAVDYADLHDAAIVTANGRTYAVSVHVPKWYKIGSDCHHRKCYSDDTRNPMSCSRSLNLYAKH